MEQGDNGKIPALEPTSSTQYMSPMGTMMAWLKGEFLTHHRRYMEYIEVDGMTNFIKAVKVQKPIKGDAKRLTFIMKN